MSELVITDSVTSTLIIDDGGQQTVTETVVETLILNEGISGPRGLTGIPGPPGAALTPITVTADRVLPLDCVAFVDALTLTTLTLPSAPNPGTKISVTGSALWRIAQNTGQRIRLGNQISAIVNGYLLSQQPGDSVDLVFNAGVWSAFSSVGNLVIG